MKAYYSRLQGRLFLQGGGLVSSGRGITASEEGLVEILIMSLLGAFVGLIAGLFVSRVMRFVQMFVDRPLAGYRWAIYGTLLGAVLFGCIAATGDKG